MAAEKNLNALITGMNPFLHQGVFVFCSLPPGVALPSSINPVCTLQESEGLSVVISQHQADEFGLQYDYVASWITLQIHSDLAAVGLTAKISAALAAAEISCNVIAGFYHDHLFVPTDRAEEAIQILNGLITQT